jgi:Rps23 Pro-64 3,4-dihydroxylase Tpa1-like proline 4-hydroxylase|tara:strand:+ start:403 stop:1002 length:600 start_codon:yes stop_codon:yes gene_type:complete
MSFLYMGDNIIPPEMLSIAYEKFHNGPIWSLTNRSVPSDNNTSFGAQQYWMVKEFEDVNKSIAEKKFNESNIIFNLWNFINKSIEVEKRFKCSLHKVHLNGNPPLYDQGVHSDSSQENLCTNDITIVCFLNTEWKMEWGGELVLYDPTKLRVIDGTFPVPGRVAAFHATIPHRGVMVSRLCPVMRISVAFQCEFDNSLN